MWKLQEQILFLLFFAPLCFCFPYLSMRTDVVLLINLLCLWLSSTIHVLTSEPEDSETHESVSEIIFFFKGWWIRALDQVFELALYIVSAIYLNVENFDGLSATLATCFENFNRFFLSALFLKKRKQGHQIAERFLCTKQSCQKMDPPSEKRLCSKSTYSQNLLMSQLGL